MIDCHCHISYFRNPHKIFEEAKLEYLITSAFEHDLQKSAEICRKNRKILLSVGYEPNRITKMPDIFEKIFEP